MTNEPLDKSAQPVVISRREEVPPELVQLLKDHRRVLKSMLNIERAILERAGITL